MGSYPIPSHPPRAECEKHGMGGAFVPLFSRRAGRVGSMTVARQREQTKPRQDQARPGPASQRGRQGSDKASARRRRSRYLRPSRAAVAVVQSVVRSARTPLAHSNAVRRSAALFPAESPKSRSLPLGVGAAAPRSLILGSTPGLLNPP